MRYQYSCALCGGDVKKPAVGTSEKKIKAGLHGWRCAACGPVKVKRQLSGK